MKNLKKDDVISNDQLVEIFKCSPQGGMRRSLVTNTLVIVSNQVNSICSDQWVEGKMHYAGMPQIGTRSIDSGKNKLLADSRKNGLSVHLFEIWESSKYTYAGEVVLSGDIYYDTQMNVNGNDRRVVVFPLKLSDGALPKATQSRKMSLLM